MKASRIDKALRALGEQLAASGDKVTIVVVGGATLSLLNLVPRTTDDVDVIALAERTANGNVLLQSAVPLPDAVNAAAARVSRDLGLPSNWLNAEVGAQFTSGLPPTIVEEITWRRYAALEVGFVGRRTLIALKLFAAVDRGPSSVHVQDLVALEPTAAELDDAATWVATQDAAPEFPTLIAEVIDHVRSYSR